jgi:hypothetical protein
MVELALARRKFYNACDNREPFESVAMRDVKNVVKNIDLYIAKALFRNFYSPLVASVHTPSYLNSSHLLLLQSSCLSVSSHVFFICTVVLLLLMVAIVALVSTRIIAVNSTINLVKC